jgi:hypothetical protein
MFSYFGTILCLGLVAGTVPADGPDRLDRLFASWEKVKRGAHSLVVELTLEKRDGFTEECQQSEGVFRLIRTPRGKVLASYDVKEKKPKGEMPAHWSGLLHGHVLYRLDHDKHPQRLFVHARGRLGTPDNNDGS